MTDVKGFWDAILTFVYLLGTVVVGYTGWLVVKGLKFITPKASKVVAKMVTEWIVDVLKPVMSDLIDQKLEPRFKSIDKIEAATHGNKETSEGVLSRLMDVANRLEDKIERLEKSEKNEKE